MNGRAGHGPFAQGQRCGAGPFFAFLAFFDFASYLADA
jgi:hypothetical protein